MKKINFSKALFLGIFAASVVLTSCDTKTTTQTPVTTTFVDSLNNTTWQSTATFMAPGASNFLGSDNLVPPFVDTSIITKLSATSILFTPKVRKPEAEYFIDTISVDLVSKTFTIAPFDQFLFKDSFLFFIFDSTTTPNNPFYTGGLYDSLRGLNDSVSIALYFKFTGAANPNATGAQKNYLFKYNNANSLTFNAPFSLTAKITSNKLKNPMATLAKYRLLNTLFGLILGQNIYNKNQVGTVNIPLPGAAIRYDYVKLK